MLYTYVYYEKNNYLKFNSWIRNNYFHIWFFFFCNRMKSLLVYTTFFSEVLQFSREANVTISHFYMITVLIKAPILLQPSFILLHFNINHPDLHHKLIPFSCNVMEAPRILTDVYLHWLICLFEWDGSNTCI